MLNARQIRILTEMYEREGRYFSAAYFARRLKVSHRTVQGDMEAVKAELAHGGMAAICAKRGKGSYLSVFSHDAFSAWVSRMEGVQSEGGSFSAERAARITFLLLDRFRPVSAYELAEECFISHATLMKDMRMVQKMVEKHHLVLRKDGSALSIEGSEIGKRLCLAENELYLAHIHGIEGEGSFDIQRISFLKDVLIDAFMESRFFISDMDFNNAVLTLGIMLERMKKSFFIKRSELAISDVIERELAISRKIFDRIKGKYLFNVPEEEIRFFAVYLKGQEIFKNHDIISKEMDLFIKDSFRQIARNYGIDFAGDTSLHIAMALHSIPLIVRVRHNLQVRSKSLLEIKRNFPLGYEIAQFFAHLLRRKYELESRISEDEVSLIAAHFYSGLAELRRRRHQTRVLVISTMKMSMTVLLRSILMKWFSREIATLDFLESGHLTEAHLDRYDIFLTTEKDKEWEKGVAMYISPFPSENDRRNIKLLLDGFLSLDSILEIFPRELFFSLIHGDKQHILEILSERAAHQYRLHGLYDEVVRREAIGSTYFGPGVAMPHPLHSVSSDTFVASALVQNAVGWDEEGDEVHLVMLVHIGKNNPQSFQLWDYFAQICKDRRFVGAVLENPTYENFISKMRGLLAAHFEQA